MFRRQSVATSQQKSPWVQGSIPAGASSRLFGFLGPVDPDRVPQVMCTQVLLTGLVLSLLFRNFWFLGAMFVALHWSFRHPWWAFIQSFFCSLAIAFMAGLFGRVALARVDAGWAGGILVFLVTFYLNITYIRRAYYESP